MTFRVTAEELYRLTEKAVKDGVSVSEFARGQVLSARAKRHRQKGREVETVTAVLDVAVFTELRRHGVNLNQIARHCNTHQVPPPPSLEPLLIAIRDLLLRDRG